MNKKTFLKDKNDLITPNTFSRRREDNDPFIITVSGDKNSPEDYHFYSSLGNHYRLQLSDGFGFWKITGDIDNIDYIKFFGSVCYDSPNNIGNFANIRASNVKYLGGSSSIWNRLYAGTLVNSESLEPARQVTGNTDSTTSTNANAFEYIPTGGAYFCWEYCLRPKFIAQDGSGYWTSIDGKFNNRSYRTYFPFNIWYQPADTTVIKSLYIGNSFANLNRLMEFKYKFEIYEKNTSKSFRTDMIITDNSTIEYWS